jgi:hypothetical protein
VIPLNNLGHDDRGAQARARYAHRALSSDVAQPVVVAVMVVVELRCRDVLRRRLRCQTGWRPKIYPWLQLILLKVTRSEKPRSIQRYEGVTKKLQVGENGLFL